MTDGERGVGDQLRAWLALSRPPFHTVGLLPFLLGSLLAWRHEGCFYLHIFAWGILGTSLIMLATYYAGEYWDIREDTLAARMGTTPFAGGSQVLQHGLLPRHAALWASITSLLLAGGVGVILQHVYHTGPWTLPIGVLGMIGGFFYSTQPVRWVKRGVGEAWIAFCYGWLTVAAGYYIQTSRLTPLIHVLALPIGLTIFNVILLNEFLDYDPDAAAGKTNLVVRLGRHHAAHLYAVTSLGSGAAMLLAPAAGVPPHVVWFYLPVLITTLIVVTRVLRGHWQQRATLEKLCGITILLNLGTTAAHIIAFVS